MSMQPAAAMQSQPVKGILLMTASIFLLTTSDAVTKWLGGTYPVGQVICLRSFFIIIPMAILVPRTGGWRSLMPVKLRGQLARALFFSASTFFIALSMILLPLATASAILFTSPLFVTALAPFVLGEQVGVRRWLAVIVGFGGVLVIINPQPVGFDILVLLPLVAALCTSLRDMTTRRISATESPNAIMFCSTVCVVFLSSFSSFFGWQPVKLEDLFLFVLSGVLVGTAHYIMIAAFTVAEAAVISPFKYTGIVWAAILGYVVFNHVPGLNIFAGAAIVIGSGLYILYRETKAR